MNEEIINKDLEDIIASKLPWERIYGKTVLISGTAGFVASYITKTLLTLNDVKKANIKVIAIVKGEKSVNLRLGMYKNRKDLKIIFHDITKPISIKDNIHYIIHAASYASPKYYISDPVGTILPNVLGTEILLTLAKEKRAEFLFISSGEVYGILRSDQIPATEDQFGYLDPSNIRSCYGESKRMGENMCVCFSHQYKVISKIVRLFHTYGPGMSLEGGRVQEDFVRDVVNSQQIMVKSNGHDIRTFCYITDTISGIFTVMLKGKSREAYNIGNRNEEISIHNLALKLVKLFPEKKLRIVQIERDKKDKYMKRQVNRVCPNTEKIEKLGWKSKVAIEEGFKRMVEYYIKN